MLAILAFLDEAGSRWMARIHPPSLYYSTYFLPGLTRTSQKIKTSPGALQIALLWPSKQLPVLWGLTGSQPYPCKDAGGSLCLRSRPESQAGPVHILALPSSGCVAMGGVLSVAISALVDKQFVVVVKFPKAESYYVVQVSFKFEVILLRCQQCSELQASTTMPGSKQMSRKFKLDGVRKEMRASTNQYSHH